MTRRLLAVFLGMTLLVLAVHDIPLATHLRDVERDRLVTSLERDAFTLAGLAEETLEHIAEGSSNDRSFLVELALSYTTTSDSSVVVTDRRGRVLASTRAGVVPDDDLAERPSVVLALDGVRNTSTHENEVTGRKELLVAVPVLSGPITRGSVEFSRPVSDIDARVGSRLSGIAVAAIVSLLLAAALGWVLARTLTEPLRRLRRATRLIATGELATRADVPSGPPEIRALAEDFNTMVDRLERVVADQRDFAGDASHQLRTPLTTLQLRVQQMLDSQGLDESQRAALGAARGELYRLERLVEGLLALARAGGTDAPLVVVDASRVVRDRSEEWEALAAESGVQLSCDAPDGLLVRAVSGALDQIVDNYLGNALEHAHEVTRIDMQVRRFGQEVEVAVIDDGPGLSAEERDRAFDRFWRGANSAAGGSGVGLAVVRRLAHASNGTVRLAAREPHGLIAKVRLRAVESERGD